MPRKYTMSEKARAARSVNAAKATAVRSSVDNYVRKIVERAPELTPEHIARLRALIDSADGGRVE
ncbi:hypothetical protein [Streptomyces prunicolor]|uniref:hypothetical protein n=1 Tax=Streptomyces prunicolor TaxID=67348 RepID=UPI0033CDD80A